MSSSDTSISATVEYVPRPLSAEKPAPLPHGVGLLCEGKELGKDLPLHCLNEASLFERMKKCASPHHQVRIRTIGEWETARDKEQMSLVAPMQAESSVAIQNRSSTCKSLVTLPSKKWILNNFYVTYVMHDMIITYFYSLKIVYVRVGFTRLLNMQTKEEQEKGSGLVGLVLSCLALAVCAPRQRLWPLGPSFRACL